MQSNIVLIGMPGVGKSTVGVILAKVIGYSFIDADLLIQKSESRLLKDIIDSDGIEGFIKIENRINSEIEATHSVIATGGSVIYGEEAMKHLSQIGTIVYLKLDYQRLKRRLGNIQNRGVVMPDGYTLRALYDERIPLYENYADITIDTQGLNIENTIAAITAQLEEL